MKSRRFPLTLAIAALLAAVALALAAHLSLFGTLRHAAEQTIDACRDAGPLGFFLAMALLPLAGFPLSPFTVAAGPVFGPTLGLPLVILCSLASIALNATLAYWIAARWFRPLIGWILKRSGQTLPEIPAGSTWIVALLVRIVPGPPFFLQSYLLGLARVPFRIYLVVSTLVPMGYIVSIVLLGDALARGDASAAAIAVALLLLVGAAIHLLRKRLMPAKPAPRPDHPN